MILVIFIPTSSSQVLKSVVCFLYRAGYLYIVYVICCTFKKNCVQSPPSVPLLLSSLKQVQTDFAMTILPKTNFRGDSNDFQIAKPLGQQWEKYLTANQPLLLNTFHSASQTVHFCGFPPTQLSALLPLCINRWFYFSLASNVVAARNKSLDIFSSLSTFVLLVTSSRSST